MNQREFNLLSEFIDRLAFLQRESHDPIRVIDVNKELFGILKSEADKYQGSEWHRQGVLHVQSARGPVRVLEWNSRGYRLFFTREPKCECGSERTKTPGHSHWCPKYEVLP